MGCHFNLVFTLKALNAVIVKMHSRNLSLVLGHQQWYFQAKGLSYLMGSENLVIDYACHLETNLRPMSSEVNRIIA